MAQVRILDGETKDNKGWIAVDDIRMTSDIVIEDFESGTFEDWTIEGDAFGDKPASNNPRAAKGLLGYGGAVFLSMPHHVFDPERDDIDISVVGGEAKFNKLDFWPIESMWLSK